VADNVVPTGATTVLEVPLALHLQLGVLGLAMLLTENMRHAILPFLIKPKLT
jgi:hypothetical protein